jgi:hypothetical protein
VVASAARRFGITRQAINHHLQQMVAGGYLVAAGNTRGRTYSLPVLGDVFFAVRNGPGASEDQVWREGLAEELASLPKNVGDICHYGFTEMFNNAMEHSGTDTITVRMIRTAAMIEITVIDGGIGVFRKVKEGLQLADEREAILELAKGKATTDPTKHTGEGIFFSSRMFDEFCMLSGRLFFSHEYLGDDWLIESKAENCSGTTVRMRIAPWATRTMRVVFAAYAAEKDDYGFSRTHVPVSLLPIGHENLISRSQAKRLLARFDRFQEVMLDFHGVNSIGQSFADEVFRVFRNQHPAVRISWVHAAPEVEQMIKRAMKASLNPTT